MSGMSKKDAIELGVIKPDDPRFVRRNGKNKYGVAPVSERTYRGKVYASKAEMRRASELWNAVYEGSVLDVIEQPRLWLGVPENVYVPDFLVITKDGCWFEDVKGMETPAFRKVLRLWRSYGRLPLIVLKTKGRNSGWERTTYRREE